MAGLRVLTPQAELRAVELRALAASLAALRLDPEPLAALLDDIAAADGTG